jgi:hypothetical protein
MLMSEQIGSTCDVLPTDLRLEKVDLGRWSHVYKANVGAMVDCKLMTKERWFRCDFGRLGDLFSLRGWIFILKFLE